MERRADIGQRDRRIGADRRRAQEVLPAGLEVRQVDTAEVPIDVFERGCNSGVPQSETSRQPFTSGGGP